MMFLGLLGLLLPAIGSPSLADESSASSAPVRAPYSRVAEAPEYRWSLPIEPPEDEESPVRSGADGGPAN